MPSKLKLTISVVRVDPKLFCLKKNNTTVKYWNVREEHSKQTIGHHVCFLMEWESPYQWSCERMHNRNAQFQIKEDYECCITFTEPYGLCDYQCISHQLNLGSPMRHHWLLQQTLVLLSQYSFKDQVLIQQCKVSR